MTEPMDIHDGSPQQQDRFADAELTRRLAHAPGIQVPADFAARVRASLPAQPVTAQPRQHTLSTPRHDIAQVVALVCAAVIAATLFALAPHAQASLSSVAFWMELLLLMELGGIAYWLTVKRAFAE